jgi:uncharacterized membrane protein
VTAIDVPVPRGRSVALTQRLGTMIVVGASAVWATGYAALAVQRHWTYGSARFDLGNMAQAVWNTAHGRFLEMTLTGGEQASRLSVHVDPILALFAPFALVVPTPELLLVGQAVALAAGAWPVLALARRRGVSEGPAVLLALAYLLCPWIAWQTQSDFHALTLAIPLLLYAVYFLDTGRPIAFAVTAGLALLCGELMGLSLIGLGAWHVLATRRWVAGSLIAAVGAVWTGLCLWVVIPAFGGGHSPFYSHFQEVGGSPGDLVKTAFTDPGAVVSALITPADLTYLILLALPLVGLFVGAPTLLLAATPMLLVNMLSSSGAMTSVRDHYIAGIVPFLFAGTVIAITRFSPRRRTLFALLVVEASGALAIAFAPWPSLALPEVAYKYRAHRVEANRDAALAGIRLIPDGVPVAATNSAGAHLSERQYFYSVPRLGQAEWVLLDRLDTWIPYNFPRPNVYGPLPGRIKEFERRMRIAGSWKLVFRRGDVVVYQRAGAPARE